MRPCRLKQAANFPSAISDRYAVSTLSLAKTGEPGWRVFRRLLSLLLSGKSGRFRHATQGFLSVF